MRLIKEVAQGVRALPQGGREIQRFAAVLSAALILLAALLFYVRRDAVLTLAVTGGTIALILAAIFIPQRLRWLHRVWMGLAFFLGGIVLRVILTIFFYLILTPIGLMLRALGKNPVPRHFKHPAESYWLERTTPAPGAETYRRPF